MWVSWVGVSGYEINSRGAKNWTLIFLIYNRDSYHIWSIYQLNKHFGKIHVPATKTRFADNNQTLLRSWNGLMLLNKLLYLLCVLDKNDLVLWRGISLVLLLGNLLRIHKLRNLLRIHKLGNLLRIHKLFLRCGSYHIWSTQPIVLEVSFKLHENWKRLC